MGAMSTKLEGSSFMVIYMSCAMLATPSMPSLCGHELGPAVGSLHPVYRGDCISTLEYCPPHTVLVTGSEKAVLSSQTPTVSSL